MPLSEAPSGEEPGTVRNQAAVAVSRAFENAGWTKSKLNKLCRGESAAKLRELSRSTPRWKSFHETVQGIESPGVLTYGEVPAEVATLRAAD